MSKERNIRCSALLLFSLCRAVPGYAEEGAMARWLSLRQATAKT